MLQWITHNKSRLKKAAIFGGMFFVAAFLFFRGSPALAQSIADSSSTLNEGVQIIEQPLGLPSTDIRVIIARIIRVALGFLGIILVVLILYAGFLWMTAGGNEEQITKAKDILKNAVIGLAIVLSAYSIVLFVMKMLGVGGLDFSGLNAEPAPGTQNFQGSGALGKAIKDHYPLRFQTNVPRNTKIVVTFYKPVKADSFIDDTNNSGVFGDCVSKGASLDWLNDCDRVKNDGGKLLDKFINVKRADNNQSIGALAALASSSTVNNVSGVFTIVLKPLTELDNHPSGGYLGSPSEPITYLVRLGNGLLWDDPTNDNPSVFSVKILGNDYYEWQFITGTELDTDPPYVQDVFPHKNSTEVKNSVIQIDFSEPIDPTGVQGEFASAGDYFYLTGKNVFLKSGNSTMPLGNFNLVNGYRTLEFTPTLACGQNACGNTIYCLPVCDKVGANCKLDDYELLLKAAKTIGGSFEAAPFSGVMDLAGNALDGNHNKAVETATTTEPVFPNWKEPDNYFWKFKLTTDMDKTAPYLSEVRPGLDAQFVPPDYPWQFLFNERMRVEPMYQIAVEEKPTPAERGDNIPLCKVPQVFWQSDDQTLVNMIHCKFLDGIKQYYYPIVTSVVEDVHFNCFYPGKGPKDKAVDKESGACAADGSGCCEVKTNVAGEDFCCDGQVSANLGDNTKCLENLKASSK